MPKQIVLGTYTITPEWTKGGKRFFAISGWTEDKQRVRQRTDTEEEAKKVVADLTQKDVLIRAGREISAQVVSDKKTVFSSALITTQARLDDVEAALRLLPTDEAGNPDLSWQLKAIVEEAIISRKYSPIIPNVTVQGIAPVYAGHYAWRNSLSPKDRNYVTKQTLKAFGRHLRRLVRLFGAMTLKALAEPGELKTRIQNAGLPPSVADKIASTFNGMALWGTEANLDPKGENPAPAHPRYLATYKPWSCPYTIRGIPEVYSLEECQALLDEAWKETVMPTRKPARSRAATMIVRIWCALRPSETDNPNFRLSEDCTLAEVPEDTKTGFRLVEVPPCAQIQLRVLKSMGLLSFKSISPQGWGIFRAKAGFPVNSAAMRGIYSREKKIAYLAADPILAEQWFRSRWPLRFKKHKADIARHTGGTAFANASQNLPKTAKFMGNSLECLDHYLGMFLPKNIPAFYQMIATPLKSLVDCTQIPLPSWFDAQHSASFMAEQEAVATLAEHLLNGFDESTDTIIKAETTKAVCSADRALETPMAA